MDKELKDWINGYLLDIFCGFLFWGAVFGICVAVMPLFRNKTTITMMTQEELLNLTECYIAVEGYTDCRSILSVMSQEYQGEFDRKRAIQAIHEALKANERSVFNCSSSNEAHIEDEPTILQHSSSKQGVFEDEEGQGTICRCRKSPSSQGGV